MKKLIGNWAFLSLLTLAIIATTKLAAMIYFGDVDFEPDSYLHFIQVADLFHEFPSNITVGLGVWAKPLYTYIFGLLLLPFPGASIIAAQLINIAISILTGMVIFAIARIAGLQGRYAFLAAVLSNASFIFFRAGMGSLTEPLFALLFTLAVLTWLRGQYLISSLIVGISVLGRLEALLFVGLWGLVLFILNWRRQSSAQTGLPNHMRHIKRFTKAAIATLPHAFLLLSPVILWNFIGYLQSGEIVYLFAKGYPKTAGVYGYGNPFTYIEGLLYQEPFLTTFMALGFALWLGNIANKIDRTGFWQSIKTQFMTESRAPQALIWLVIVVFTLVQTVLYTLGLFGTAGLMRYFAVIIPLFALPAAWGFKQLTQNKSRVFQVSSIVILCLLQLGFSLSAIKAGGFYKGLYNKPFIVAEIISIWQEPEVIAAAGESDYIYANRPELVYYSINPSNGGKRFRLTQMTNSSLPAKTLVIIDLNWFKHDSGKEFPLDSPEKAFYLKPINCVDRTIPTKLTEVKIDIETYKYLRVYQTDGASGSSC